MSSPPADNHHTPSAELLIIEPPPSCFEAASSFIGQCIMLGLDLHIESGDKLPRDLSANVQGVKAIVCDQTQAEAVADQLKNSPHASGRLYVLAEQINPSKRVGLWNDLRVIHQIIIDAGLTLAHPAQFQRFTRRPIDQLADAMVEHLLTADQNAWHDATRYQWEALLDTYAFTQDPRAYHRLEELIDQALRTVNPLDTCDTVAPLLPLLRFAQITGDQTMSVRAVDMLRTYVHQTPRYKKCFVNFRWLGHHVRSEVVWQVCPVLAAAGVMHEANDLLDVAIDQATRMDALLLDRASGWWRHGIGDQQQSVGLWGRGCAMVLLGLMHVVEAMPDPHPQRSILLERVQSMAQLAVDCQHPSGFWSMLLDQPDSEAESSATAWFTAALYRGMRTGLLVDDHRLAADRGWNAVTSRLWQGRFPGHNVATTVSAHLPYYQKLHLSPGGWTHFAYRAYAERRRHFDATS